MIGVGGNEPDADGLLGPPDDDGARSEETGVPGASSCGVAGTNNPGLWGVAGTKGEAGLRGERRRWGDSAGGDRGVRRRAGDAAGAAAPGDARGVRRRFAGEAPSGVRRADRRGAGLGAAALPGVAGGLRSRGLRRGGGDRRGGGLAGGSSPLSAMPIYRSRGVKERTEQGGQERGLQGGCDAASCAWVPPLHCASTQTTQRGPGIAIWRQARPKPFAAQKG